MKQSNPEPCESAEILRQRPLSGEFEEVLFGSEQGNSLLWIKFSDKDGITEWIGKFGSGSFSTWRVNKVKEPDFFWFALVAMPTWLTQQAGNS